MAQRADDSDGGRAGPKAAEPRHRLLTVCGGTDAGVRAAENQDTFVIAELESGRISRPCVRTDLWVARPGLLMLVCDGMGGPSAGDVASGLAAASIKHELQGRASKVVEAPNHSLKRAVITANKAILAEAKAHPNEEGMATTCTAAVFSPNRLAIAQVGNSRAYLLRQGQLRTLTRDQTVASDLVEVGILTAEQVEVFPYRHTLVQALGSDPNVEPVITNLELREGDRLLLCSDGLHGTLSDKMIAAMLNVQADVSEVSKVLIAAALAAGAPDNVTVVVADCGPLGRQRPLAAFQPSS